MSAARGGRKLPSQQEKDLAISIDGLRTLWPTHSAHVVLTRTQSVTAAVGVVLMILALVWRPITALQLVVGFITVVYGGAIAFRIALVWAAGRQEHRVWVSEEEARAVPDAELPPYTVLVPAYREPQVIRLLMEHLAALEYPVDKLDIKLLLEADDAATIAAARPLAEAHVDVVIVPASRPQTKPKACNYGLQTARGELVTIYDAEDRPEPLQLRRAAVALRRLGPSYACLQAELGYFNTYQNRLTRWFTLEYASWFRSLLPGLVAFGMPIPLGGTSNHFRTTALRTIGAWDPFNVTEDADLGMRLARLGHQVGVLHAVTLEEANSDFINWVKQRSRWYKGYLMTWLVHMRSPGRTWRQLGWRGLFCLHFFVGGTPLTALVNPVFWAMTILWVVARPPLIQQLFVAPVYYLALLCMVFGNLAVIYLNVLVVRQMERPNLLWSALISPAYWAMMSIAAMKAGLQLLLHPSYWEKTTHGLHLTKATTDAR